ncbi:recombinase family protein [Agrobacterium burrii]|uniref:recombinase family protein n=1 Tax=Agrobacterium burrii TaxID=2815339 RepID=UPI001FEF2705|nr:recombinase family protein [Agrobacterium burrii]
MHALKRVVLYARYSTDQQNPSSIDTQFDLGKEFVVREGRHLVDTFVDAGVSGSSFEARPGLYLRQFVRILSLCQNPRAAASRPKA